MDICKRCGSKHIHQISMEIVEYCLKDNKVHEIKWDSTQQKYECQFCGFTLEKI